MTFYIFDVKCIIFFYFNDTMIDNRLKLMHQHEPPSKITSLHGFRLRLSLQGSKMSLWLQGEAPWLHGKLLFLQCLT